MLTIASKSALKKEDLLDKAKRGSHFVELAMGMELDENTPLALYRKSKQDGLFNIMGVTSIHAPATGIDCLIEHKACHERIERTCEFANAIAQHQSHELPVVIHTSTNFYEMNARGEFEQIADMLDKCLKRNPGISLNIESHSEFHINPATHSIHPLQSWSVVDGELIIGATGIASQLETPKIAPMIDVCHYDMIGRYIQHIADLLEDEELMCAGYKMPDACLKKDAKSANVIHLAQALSHGYGSNFHACPYSRCRQSDMTLLRRHLSNIIAGGFDGTLVLEVSEQCYTESTNYTETLEAVRTVLDVMGVPYQF